MIKRILISGGRSVLGVGLADRWRAAGCEVWQASRTALGSPSSIAMDVSDAQQVKSVVEAVRPQLVFHLAASYDPDIGSAYRVNVLGLQNLVEATTAAKLSCRIVAMGSAAEYGVVEAGANPLSETQALRPVSTYGLTKAWQTMYGLKAAFEGHDVVVARMFNLDAAGLPTRLFVGSIESQIQQILACERSHLETGELTAVRDYVSLDDALDQLQIIATRGSAGSVYHVGSGTPVDMKELVDRKMEAAGLSPSLWRQRPPASTRPGYDVPMVYANMSKTHALYSEPQ